MRWLKRNDGRRQNNNGHRGHRVCSINMRITEHSSLIRFWHWMNLEWIVDGKDDDDGSGSSDDDDKHARPKHWQAIHLWLISKVRFLIGVAYFWAESRFFFLLFVFFFLFCSFACAMPINRICPLPMFWIANPTHAFLPTVGPVAIFVNGSNTLEAKLLTNRLMVFIDRRRWRRSFEIP